MDSNIEIEDILSPIQILKKGNLKRGLILQNIIEKYSVLDESPEINCDYESDVEDYDLDDKYNVKKRLKTKTNCFKKKLFSMHRLEKLLPFTSTPIVTRSLSSFKKHNFDVQLSPSKEIKESNNNNNNNNSVNVDKTPEAAETTTTNKSNQESTNLDNKTNEQLSKQPVVLLTPLNKINKKFIQLNNTQFKLFDLNNNKNKDNITQTAAALPPPPPPSLTTTTTTTTPIDNQPPVSNNNNNGNNDHQQELPPAEILNDPLFDIFKTNPKSNNNKKIRISEIRSCSNDDNNRQEQEQQEIETITTTTTTTTTTMITATAAAVEVTKTRIKGVDKLKEIFLTQTYRLNEIVHSDKQISEERRLVLEKRRLDNNNNKIINDPLKMLFMRN